MAICSSRFSAPLSSSSSWNSSSSSSLLPGRLRRRVPRSQFDLRGILPLGSLQSPAEGRPEGDSTNGTFVVKRSARKPRPSFYKQTVERWSLKTDSCRDKFPWQVDREVEDVTGVLDGGGGGEDDVEGRSIGFGSEGSQSHWNHGGRIGDDRFGSDFRSQVSHNEVEYAGNNNDGIPQLEQRNSRDVDKVVIGGTEAVYPQKKGTNSSSWVRGLKPRTTSLNAGAGTPNESKGTAFGGQRKAGVHEESMESRSDGLNSATPSSYARKGFPVGKTDVFPWENRAMLTPMSHKTEMRDKNFNFKSVNSYRLSSGLGTNDDIENVNFQKGKSSFIQKRNNLNSNSVDEQESVSGTGNLMHDVSLPWKSESSNVGQSERKVLRKRSNTQLAERTIPEPELRRLRNVALRMKERTKVGSAGVTEALVKTIREKWRMSEIVKLKFEGPPAINMKRTHEILERRTGGLVIWRSGSSIVLYRGMIYKLPCAKSYSESDGSRHTLFQSNDSSDINNTVVKAKDLLKYVENSKPDINALHVETSNGCSDEFNIDGLLDGLGPRYIDWSGSKPLPVDADSLPTVIPGYKPPLRLLPFGVKTALWNKEMTYLRRLARSMPPHFALGRNRSHQGLAKAMVKLWEKSIIAKIAIKRGVPNTCNDRMAEELKALTGGVLLSRNKEFIVFYRGNDFLTPSIAEVVAERQKLADIMQNEEEKARKRASEALVSNSKSPELSHLAGTLAETLEAKVHWDDEPSNEDRKQMMRDAALSKHASLIRFMEKKLHFAKEKVKKAERALAIVQRSLDPSELPTDLETVTDEERFLFRKMGLKMRGFLSLGRRGVFDGTIENIHLNWKHRELVKILVKGKNFAQLKQVAISLEAESGGVLISLDKTTKGYAIILYRGKNYQRPHVLRPRNLLTKRKALERSIELQRREALKYHISNLQNKIEIMKSELEKMEGQDISDSSAHIEMNDVFCSYDDANIEEGEEAYLETYEMDSEEEVENNDASS